MKKRRHLTLQVMFMICILAAGAILVCWIINTIFLERYYVQQKKVTMVEDFQTMSEASSLDLLLTDGFDATFDYICDNDNMTIYVSTTSGQILRTSAPDRTTLQDDMESILRGVDRSEMVTEGDDYAILSMEDTRLNSEYLVLVGTLPGGDVILMRTALESIRESAQLSNRLLLIVGLVMIVISAVVGGVLARRITRPILQLTNISKKMVDLDFEAKYVPGEWRNDPDLKIGARRRHSSSGEDAEEVPGNEIDLLGDHMNRLSETLESTISELKSANATLTQDIEQRTQIDEMRKEFLSNVSHELKTPLALIQGYAEGLEECINDDPESREFYCDVILDEAGKMNQLVQQLLSLNQLEFGNDRVEMERFDLTEMILGVCGASRILMEKQGITLDTSGLDTRYVWGDSFMIEQVVNNFLSNAIHHCEGEKLIRIFYTLKGDILRTSVFNTGQPIPQEDIDQVWDKFYKVDKARTREYGGSGIGLSIVKAVMDSHGQACGVINHTDGVEFWMELPMK